LRQPKPLAVIGQHAKRGGPAAPKEKQAAGKGIGRQFFPAQLDERVDALTPIDGFDRHQDAHLRGDLQHGLLAEKSAEQMS
jgi:hypothetical protein